MNMRIEAINASDCQPLLEAWQNNVPLLDAWQDHWLRLWPKTSSKHAAALARIASIFMTHIQNQTVSELDDSSAERSRLEGQLVWEFRRSPMQPAAAFAHLALVALDLERLRGNIQYRVLFRKNPVKAA
jgi:hypothetical protein